MNSDYKPDHDKIKNQGPTFSIVVETENLGMAGMDDLKDTLKSLQEQSYDISHAKEVIIVAAGHISPETFSFLTTNYPWITIHRESEKLEYMQSKQKGASVATGEVVVFADSDVIYEPTWLENILYGFIAAPGAAIVTGETRIRGNSLYITAIQLSWMMNMVFKPKYPTMVNHFHFNNFAIKREIFLQAPLFLGLPIYRAVTVEMKKWFFNRGYSSVRVPNARGYHLTPGNVPDWWYRMLVFGADPVVKADFDFNYDGSVTKTFRPFRRIIRVPMFIGFKLYVLATRSVVMIREDWKNSFRMIASLPIMIVSLFVMVLGSCVAVVNRDYLFKKSAARETAHVV